MFINVLLIAKQELRGKQEKVHDLEEELNKLRETCDAGTVKHAEELAKYRTTFEEELNGVITKHKEESDEMKLKLELLEKENGGLKDQMEKEKQNMKEMTGKENKNKGKKNEALLVELKNVKEQNEALKKELETQQK